jgi:hypothetical protein
MERDWTVGRAAEWLALAGRIFETAGRFLKDLSEDLVARESPTAAASYRAANVGPARPSVELRSNARRQRD